MRASNGCRAVLGLVVSVMVLACSKGQTDEAGGEDSADSADSMVALKDDDTCEVDHSTLSGALTSTNIKEALKQAKTLTKKGKKDTHGSGDNVSTITAICGSHEFHTSGKPQLDLGQFVAVIDIKGLDTKYSTEKNDVVYIWIYGNTSPYTAQLVSMKLEKVIADKPMSECGTSAPTAEEAHWTPSDKCPKGAAVSADLTQHTPWWACWLGCCYVSDS